MRKRIALLASIILAAQLTGCTSKDSASESEGGDDVVAESSEGSEELDAAATDGGAVASSDANGSSEGFLDDQLPADALGESTNTASQDAPPADAGTPPADPGAPPAGVADNSMTPPSDSPPPSNDVALDEALGSVDTGTNAPPPDQPPAISDASTPSDTSTSSTIAGLTDTPSTGATSSSEEPKPKASLKKVEATPFKRKGVLLNAVYIARPGDDYKKISELIYGNKEKSKEIAKANPSLGKKPKPGDKVYYNSPARPTDDTKVMTFYEDSGMMPELYVAKEGDNLKTVSKELLGYENAWKEIWATNGIESKGELAAGTELRYWKSAPAAHSEVAANPPPMEPPAAAPPAELPPPPPVEATPPPVAANDLPPPPPAEMAPPPPADLPPPPPAEAMNPPPPPPMPKQAANMGEPGGMDQDMMMTLAGAGIITLGLAAIIIMRKRRQERDRMNNAFSDTQVGT